MLQHGMYACECCRHAQTNCTNNTPFSNGYDKIKYFFAYFGIQTFKLEELQLLQLNISGLVSQLQPNNLPKHIPLPKMGHFSKNVGKFKNAHLDQNRISPSGSQLLTMVYIERQIPYQ